MTAKTQKSSSNGGQEEMDSMSLLGATTRMTDALKMMHNINLKANFIALNAAIEAARSQSQTENFALVADQISRQAQRTEELAEKLESEISNLRTCALKATAVRFADIASDIIDKLDRNLFERNCDCQAWATFDSVQNLVNATRDWSADRVTKLTSDMATTGQADEAGNAVVACSEQLAGLVETYRVYEDSFVVNNSGVIVASAKRTKLVGTSVTNHDFFQAVVESKQVHVTDMNKSSLTGSWVVSYSAPILSATGELIGVLSNRFNWDYAQEIIDKMPLDGASRAYVIASDGTVIAASKRRGILTDHLGWATSAEAAMAGGSGYTIETARNGQIMAYGYCQTRGFGAYPGKGWSAIVCHPVDLKLLEHIHVKIERDGQSHLHASEIANRDLVKVAGSIKEHVRSINFINNETNMLAVNASIQAGVAGAEGESFSVIASEIGRLAKQSEEFVHVVNSLTEVLGGCVQSTVAVRLGDAAFDTIDKVDRNLFERYCDVQAFASFRQLVECAKSGRTTAEAQELLKRAHAIYEVYHDIFLLDAKGTILASAIRRELVGTNQADRDWFRECTRGNIVVSDVYRSKSINDYTVTFAAPVKDHQGNLVGVITTRFNCSFVYGILKAAIIGEESRICLLNSKGLLIGSPAGEGILDQSYVGLKAFKAMEVQASGFVSEVSPTDQQHYAIGFARTPGYNTYKGKGWSVIIMRRTQEVAATPVAPIRKAA